MDIYKLVVKSINYFFLKNNKKMFYFTKICIKNVLEYEKCLRM